MRYAYRSALILVAFLLFVPGRSLIVADDQVGRAAGVLDEWTEWLGGERQGSSLTDGPREWSSNQNQRWATPIPGRGTSSPLVKDGLVIVTSSYLTNKANQLQQIILVSIGLLSGISLYFGAAIASRELMRVSAWRSAISFNALNSTLLMFLFLVLFGASVCDFDRCPIRAWMGAASILTLSLLLASASCQQRSTWRAILSLSTLLLSAFFLFKMPGLDHALRDAGGMGARIWVVVLAVSFPFGLGLLSLLSPIVHHRQSESRAMKWGRRISLFLCALVTTIVGAKIVSGPVDPPPVEGNPVGILIIPTLAWSAVTILWGLQFFVLCGRSGVVRVEGEPDGAAWRRVNPIMATMLVATAGITILCIWVLIHQGYYLPYHLPLKRMQPLIGWWPLFAISAIVAGLLGLSYSLGKMPSERLARQLFCLFVVSLGILTFVSTTSLKDQQVLTRAILAFDAETGEQKWACEGLEGPESALHRYNSAASPTPVIAGDRVMAYFGCGGVLCSDMSGHRLWANPEIRFESIYGVGASLRSSDGVLVIANGMPKGGYIAGLDCSSGATRWRYEMRGEAVSGNSRTPLIETINGQKTVLAWGFEGLVGLDLDTGHELWHYDIGDGGGDQVSSLLRSGNQLICIGREAIFVLQIDLLGKDSTAPIIWKLDSGAVNCASPAIANGMAFCVSDTGIACCIDLKKRKMVSRRRLPGAYYSSPIVCGKQVYFTNIDGVTSVLQADAGFKPIGENQLPGEFLASPAPVQGRIYVRSSERLFCLQGEQKESSDADDSQKGDGVDAELVSSGGQ